MIGIIETSSPATSILPPINAVPAAIKRRRAKSAPVPETTAASPPRRSEAANCVVTPKGALPLSGLISDIKQWYRQRVNAVTAQLRISNQVGALARSVLGWRLDLPKKEQERISARALAAVKKLEAGEAVEGPIALLFPFVIAAAEARKPFDEYREELEERLREVARRLPVWSWAESVKGLAELSLAKIVGEAGDLSGYANPGKLWKRMGLAVHNGKRQCRTRDVEEALEQGYCPRRRSVMWVIGQSLIRSRDAYYAIYLKRKAYELERNPEMTRKHAHNRARRYMEKALLRDLWREWRGSATHQSEAYHATV